MTESNEEEGEAFRDALEEVFSPFTDPRFNENFQEDVNEEASELLQVLQPTRSEEEDPFMDPVDIDDISLHISKKNTACGPDGISNQRIRNGKTAWATIVLIFNACLTFSYYPKAWKEMHTIMLPKPKKDLRDPKNYRPICLTSHLGKLLERIINKLISNQMDKFIPDHQYGFRKHRTASDPAVLLSSLAAEAVNRGHILLALFLDIERAFDKVWHDGLIVKLSRSGLFGSRVLTFINSFLRERTGRIRVNSTLSDTYRIQSGVPQGTVLSPLLFSLYCRDMPTEKNTFTIQYADDTAKWVIKQSWENALKTLQSATTSLERWMSNWRIRPTPNKSNMILFSRHCRYPAIFINLWGGRVYNVRSTVYLGITFDRALSSHEHINTTWRKCRRRCNLLKMMRAGGRGMSTEATTFTYKTFVRPVAKYACLAVLPRGLFTKQLACLERNALRAIHLLPNIHPSKDVYTISGIEPLLHRLTRLRCNAFRRIHLHNPALADTILSPLSRPLTRKPRVKHISAGRVMQRTYDTFPGELPEFSIHTPIHIPDHLPIIGYPVQPIRRRRKKKVQCSV